MPSNSNSLSQQANALRQYGIITANYWAFTLTDGALRMLVVLYFHTLGYSPLEVALLFVFYEAFGVITNLLGGWLGARIGLNNTMNIGLAIQVIALAALLVPSNYLNLIWVMGAQALSGIAKDLNKMSAKSAIKSLVPKDQNSTLFKWVALLTGSKNALKGVGFFMGGVLLTAFGFQGAVLAMVIGLSIVWLLSVITLKNTRRDDNKNKPKFSEIFSKSASINYLSAARLFLFGARDVWFVIALPVFLSSELAWEHRSVGTFLAVWIIFYGLVQSFVPGLFSNQTSQQHNKHGQNAFKWAIALAVTPITIAIMLNTQIPAEISLVIGLLFFGAIFAVNSSLHSYLVVHFASEKNVSMDVGFYYMANAMGRLIGTVLSGILFQYYGLEACLIVSTLFILIAASFALQLDSIRPQQA